MPDKSSIRRWPLLLGAGTVLGASLALFEETVSQQTIGVVLLLISCVLLGAALVRGPEPDDPE